jgi:hypothetical protein
MSAIARRWIVSTGELWLPDGSPTSKPDPETEDWVVLAEDYDALADQLRGAVEAAREQIKALIMAQSAAGRRDGGLGAAAGRDRQAPHARGAVGR